MVLAKVRNLRLRWKRWLRTIVRQMAAQSYVAGVKNTYDAEKEGR